MPELPEVELARRSLVKWFDGASLKSAEPEPKARTFRGSDPKAFKALKGPLTQARRKGKYLLLEFGDAGALFHLGMTGKFVKRQKGVAEPYSRARMVLDSGEVIHFKDTRLFGRIETAPATELDQLDAVAALGIDPLNDGLSPKQLQQALSSTRQGIKVALMDQSRVCGLGNIHAAEALYRAKINPARAPKTLKAAEWSTLNRAILDTIAFALEEENGSDEITYVEEDPSKNPFLVYGRAGQRCRRCKTEIKSFTQGGRTTFFCPGCQPKKPKVKK